MRVFPEPQSLGEHSISLTMLWINIAAKWFMGPILFAFYLIID